MALLCSQLGLVLELICWQRKDKEKELSWRYVLKHFYHWWKEARGLQICLVLASITYH